MGPYDGLGIEYRRLFGREILPRLGVHGGREPGPHGPMLSRIKLCDGGLTQSAT